MRIWSALSEYTGVLGSKPNKILTGNANELAEDERVEANRKYLDVLSQAEKALKEN